MIKVKSYPDKELDYEVSVPTSIDSGELIQNFWIDLSQTTFDNVVEIEFNGEFRTILIKDEYRYTPVTICFLNKQGALQTIDFFKERKDTVERKKEDFEANLGQGKHQYQNFNIQSRTSFTINSGFISEDNNEIINQLLLSRKVWQLLNGTMIPLTYESEKLDKKTRVNDGLIEYTLSFKYAFNDINNV